jgi:hypothetical protein
MTFSIIEWISEWYDRYQIKKNHDALMYKLHKHDDSYFTQKEYTQQSKKIIKARKLKEHNKALDKEVRPSILITKVNTDEETK